MDYLARVGWARGRLTERGGNVCKRQILQISVFVGEEGQYAKKKYSSFYEHKPKHACSRCNIPRSISHKPKQARFKWIYIS